MSSADNSTQSNIKAFKINKGCQQCKKFSSNIEYWRGLGSVYHMLKLCCIHLKVFIISLQYHRLEKNEILLTGC